MKFSGFIKSIWIISAQIFLSACVAPVYEGTTFGVDEFVLDSQQIGEGKYAILAMEEKELPCCFEMHGDDDERVIDGDELSVVLHCPNRADRTLAMRLIGDRVGFPVSHGTICLPYLSSIDISGLTLAEVRCRIQEVYSSEIADVKVYVNFKKKRERIVQIIGAESSSVIVDGRMRLSEVLAIARVPPHANLFKSYVMRDGIQLPVDLYKLIHKGDESQNLVMQGGDQIFIANAFDATVVVTGEFGYSIVVPVLYGNISLRETLSRAGGIAFTGNKECIQVIRGGLTSPKIYVLKWKDIVHIPNQSLLLIPGDIIVVTEKPITEWNRFINQLQPSTGCLQSVFNVYNAVHH